MAKYEVDLDKLIEKKRSEYLNNDDINIDIIINDIKKTSIDIRDNKLKQELNITEFLKCDDDKFIRMLYISILYREPNDHEYREIMTNLKSGIYSRIQLIRLFLISEEGKRRNNIIRGLKKYIFIDRLLRLIKKIPILGFLFRLLKNIIFLSRNLYNLNIEDIKLNERIKDLISEINDLKDEMKAMEEKAIKLQGLSIKVENEKSSNKELLDKLYLHYNENLMPDSREDVKRRECIYLKKISDKFEDLNLEYNNLKIIDLGCGEGEWLELLLENGYNAIGIDSNKAVLDKVNNQFPDLQIVEDDSINYLKGCQDSSVDLITCFHMVEHMDYKIIFELLNECYRVLKSEGMLIIETPNPQNILVSTYYFYLDPTHVKQIPIELMEFYINETGFKIIDKLLLNELNYAPYDYKEKDAISDLLYRINMEQAYSIIASK